MRGSASSGHYEVLLLVYHIGIIALLLVFALLMSNVYMLHFYTNIKQFYNKMTFVLRVAGNILTRTEKQQNKNTPMITNVPTKHLFKHIFTVKATPLTFGKYKINTYRLFNNKLILAMQI